MPLFSMATFVDWLMFDQGIDEKLEEMKKEGKRLLSEEMSQAAASWAPGDFQL